jgi:2-polyprenyl-6-methoxyphenol hydroxylase-like FAD-dependent oxidoreductase
MGQPGLLLAGDSSHSIHPLAGMGFNLALGDIAVICDCLDSARNNGLSFSHPSILTDYQAKRRVEIEAIIGVTQGLNRLFSHKSFQLKLLPSGLIDFGLGVMDMLPIKKQLTQIATGGVLTSARLFSDI